MALWDFHNTYLNHFLGNKSTYTYMVIIRVVDLMHLHVVFATQYNNKMDSAKIGLNHLQFKYQILFCIFLHISWVRAYKFMF